MEQTKKDQRGTADNSQMLKNPRIAGAVLIVIVLLFMGGYIFNKSPVQPTTVSVQPSPDDSVQKKSWTTFTHPTAGYIVQYPSNWIGGIVNQDFSVKSPDYQMSSEDFPVLEKGAEFLIRVKKTNHSTIDDVFNNDPLASKIAFNKTTMTVDGLPAIQYDFDYEGYRATETILTKNGNYYAVMYRYVDDTSKLHYWNDYIRLLSSFKIK